MERVRTPKNLKKAFGRALHRGMITEEEHDEYLALLSKRLADRGWLTGLPTTTA